MFHQSSVGGSSLVALDAIGRPAGLDAGCHSTCMSLTGVLERVCSQMFAKSLSNQSIKTIDHLESHQHSCPSSRNLICLYYEKLIELIHQNRISDILCNDDMLGKLYLELLQSIAQTVSLDNFNNIKQVFVFLLDNILRIIKCYVMLVNFK